LMHDMFFNSAVFHRLHTRLLSAFLQCFLQNRPLPQVFQWSNSEAPANSWAAVFNGTTHHHLPPPPSSTTAKSYKTLANRLLFSLSFNDDHDHDLMTLFVYNDDDHDHQFCKIQKWSYITYKFCNELHEFAFPMCSYIYVQSTVSQQMLILD
ncbi:hypothetical protein T4B_5719, partial [Trichinella pseudospiralis]